MQVRVQLFSELIFIIFALYVNFSKIEIKNKIFLRKIEVVTLTYPPWRLFLYQFPFDPSKLSSSPYGRSLKVWLVDILVPNHENFLDIEHIHIILKENLNMVPLLPKKINTVK